MRLDLAIVERGLTASRTQAQAAIARGDVLVDGCVCVKACATVTEAAQIAIANLSPYASRGGIKLAAALDRFGLDPGGLSCLDVGASTGGFTDCLLQRGAAHVTAVDVGSGQMIERLKCDARVTLIENVNVRFLDDTNVRGPFDLVVADVSFISLRLLLGRLSAVIDRRSGRMVVLIKPQFEVGRDGVGRGGIVRDETLRQRSVESVISAAASADLESLGVIESPILGGDGNHEFLAVLRPISTEAGNP